MYNNSLIGKGGVTTFVKNFCKRMSKHYVITLVFHKADNKTLMELSQYVNIKQYSAHITDKVVILSSNANNVKINSKNVIQVLHADYREQEKQFKIKYIKNPATTKHVAVGEHVKEVFEELYPYKVDRVIFNLLDVC